MTWGVAIESSASQSGSAALFKDGQCRTQMELSDDEKSAQHLIPMVKRLLDEAELTTEDVSWLATSIGPGSFTGLRVAITFAKLFCWRTGARLFGIPTTVACAVEQAAVNSSRLDREQLVVEDPDKPQRIHVVLDAQRRQYFLQQIEVILRDGYPVIGQVSAIEICDAASLEQQILASLNAIHDWTGPGLEKLASKQSRVRDALELTSRSWPKAEIVGRIALSDTDGRWGIEPEHLKPIYARASAAEEKWAADHSLDES